MNPWPAHAVPDDSLPLADKGLESAAGWRRRAVPIGA